MRAALTGAVRARWPRRGRGRLRRRVRSRAAPDVDASRPAPGRPTSPSQPQAWGRRPDRRRISRPAPRRRPAPLGAPRRLRATAQPAQLLGLGLVSPRSSGGRRPGLPVRKGASTARGARGRCAAPRGPVEVACAPARACAATASAGRQRAFSRRPRHAHRRSRPRVAGVGDRRVEQGPALGEVLST